MRLVEQFHGRFIQERRVKVLVERISKILPPQASVLDVGSGDGLLAHKIAELRPDLMLEGLDVLIRDKTYIPVSRFDGNSIPKPDHSYDIVMFVDVLHHTNNIEALLKEAKRVARKAIIIKDHTCDGVLAFETLKFMDQVGNKRYGVVLPHNYWKLNEWRRAIEQLGLRPSQWNGRLNLYPFPLNLAFDRSLHFICALEVA